ncbi:MAG: hypothetical protein RLY66_251 [Candidatus Parcubacteria bacterium]|jgi:hypothetical protein
MEEADEGREDCYDSRMNPSESHTHSVSAGKLIGALILGWYFISYAFGDPSHALENWNFIDNVDLVIHEAGHFIFMFFGQFLQVLGGSFLQVILPAIFTGYFFVRRQYFSGSIVAFWVGQNIINVATYLGDAVRQQLPLLGGDSVMHDWNYLLSQMNLLNYTDSIASFVHGSGVIVIIAAAISSIFFSLSDERRQAVLNFFKK